MGSEKAKKERKNGGIVRRRPNRKPLNAEAERTLRLLLRFEVPQRLQSVRRAHAPAVSITDMGEAHLLLLVYDEGGRVRGFVFGVPAQAKRLGKCVIGINDKQKIFGPLF